jgi:hypothetical protein
MSNRYKNGIIVLVISAILMVVLVQYFNIQRFYLLVINVLGVTGGLSMALFKAYANPNQWIYHYRFILIGTGFGSLIGLGFYLGSYQDSQVIVFKDLLKSLIVSIPIGIIISGGISYISNRQLSKKAKTYIQDQILICDSARCETPELISVSGVLVLTPKVLVFYPDAETSQLKSYKLEDIQVKLSFSGSFKIPKGILINDEDELLVAYPKYWCQHIQQLLLSKDLVNVR